MGLLLKIVDSSKIVICFFALFLLVAAPVLASGPAPVDLGTSGDFVVLAKSGITTTGATSLFGDIGVSPIAAVSMTGFG